MLPGEIYEAARVDGVHPLKVFFRVTLPLLQPGAPGRDHLPGAGRAADLRPDLRPDRQQQVDHVDVGLRAAAAGRFPGRGLRLGRGDAAVPAHRRRSRSSTSRWPAPGGRSRPMGRRLRRLVGRLAFYVLVADHRPLHGVPVLLGDRVLAQDRLEPVLGRLLVPLQPAWSNYVAVFREQPFARNIAQLAVRRRLDGRGLAGAGGGRRLRARADQLPRPAAAAVHDPRRLDVPADRRAFGHVRAGPGLGPLQHPAGADPQLHDLYPAVHGLGA